MKALVKTKLGENSLTYQEMPEPQAKAGELKIRVHACGVCASDLHIWHDTYPSSPPVIMGHEYSGIVEAVGEGVKDFQVGDRVVSMTAIIACEHCSYCFDGLRMHCKERLSIGSGTNGAYAPYLTVPAKFAFHIPPSVSMNAAALCEPLACAVRGVVERTALKGGDYILVSGAGVVGQLAAQVAKACGGIVVMAGMHADAQRLALAKKLGAYAVIDVEKEDVEAAALRLTNGRGFDAAFECSGAAASAENCIRALRRVGQFTQIGLYGKPISFDMDKVLMKEITVSNSYASEYTSWERALRLLEYGLIEVEPLIGKELPLSDWEEGFCRVDEKKDFKVLLVP